MANSLIISYVDVFAMSHILEVIEGICRPVGIDKLIEFVAMEILHKVSCRYNFTSHDLSCVALSALLLALKICSEIYPMMKFKKLLELFAGLSSKKPHLMSKVSFSELKDAVLKLEMVLITHLGFDFEYLRITGREGAFHRAVSGLHLSHELVPQAESILDTREYKCSNICVQFTKSTIVCAMLKRLSGVKFIPLPPNWLTLVPKVLASQDEASRGDSEAVSERDIDRLLEVLAACRDRLPRARASTMDETQSSTEMTTPQATTPQPTSPFFDSEARSVASASSGQARPRSMSGILEAQREQADFLASVQDLVAEPAPLSVISTLEEHAVVGITITEDRRKLDPSGIVSTLRSFERPDEFAVDFTSDKAGSSCKISVRGYDPAEVLSAVGEVMPKLNLDYRNFEAACQLRFRAPEAMLRYFFESGRPWIDIIRVKSKVTKLESSQGRFVDIHGRYKDVSYAYSKMTELWPSYLVDLNLSTRTTSVNLHVLRSYSSSDIFIQHSARIDSQPIQVSVRGHDLDKVEFCARDMMRDLAGMGYRAELTTCGQAFEFPAKVMRIILGKGGANVVKHRKDFSCSVKFGLESPEADLWLIILRAKGWELVKQCRNSIITQYEYFYNLEEGYKRKLIDLGSDMKRIEEDYNVFVCKETLREMGSAMKISGLQSSSLMAFEKLTDLIRDSLMRDSSKKSERENENVPQTSSEPSSSLVDSGVRSESGLLEVQHEQADFLASVQDLVSAPAPPSAISTLEEHAAVDITIAEDRRKLDPSDIISTLRSFERPDEFAVDITFDKAGSSCKISVRGYDPAEVLSAVGEVMPKLNLDYQNFEAVCQLRFRAPEAMLRYFFESGRPWIDIIRAKSKVTKLESSQGRFVDIHGRYKDVSYAYSKMTELWPCHFVDLNFPFSTARVSLNLLRSFSSSDIFIQHSARTDSQPIQVSVRGHDLDKVESCARDMMRELADLGSCPEVMHGLSFEFPAKVMGVILGKGGANVMKYKNEYLCSVKFGLESPEADLWVILLRAKKRSLTEGCRNSIVRKYEVLYTLEEKDKRKLIGFESELKTIEENCNVYICRETLRERGSRVKISGVESNTLTAVEKLLDLVREASNERNRDGRHRAHEEERPGIPQAPFLRNFKEGVNDSCDNGRILRMMAGPHYFSSLSFDLRLANELSLKERTSILDMTEEEETLVAFQKTEQSMSVNIYSSGSILKASKQVHAVEGILDAAQRRMYRAPAPRRRTSFYAQILFSPAATAVLGNIRSRLNKLEIEFKDVPSSVGRFFRIRGQSDKSVLGDLRRLLDTSKHCQKDEFTVIKDLVMLNLRLCSEFVEATLGKRYLSIPPSMAPYDFNPRAYEAEFRISINLIDNRPECLIIIIDGDDRKVSVAWKYIQDFILNRGRSKRDRNSSFESRDSCKGDESCSNSYSVEKIRSSRSSSVRPSSDTREADRSEHEDKRQRLYDDRYVPEPTFNQRTIVKASFQEEEDGEIVS